MKKIKIGIVGLGYVGLPLALALGKYFSIIGYDKNQLRIDQLNKDIDITKEVAKKDFIQSRHISFTKQISKLRDCNFFIVTVPTPVNKRNKPDLSYLKSATHIVSKFVKKDDIVVYESTGFPGMTEEICVPILENNSCLKYNKDFYCGYSPERINPGDKKHRINNIKKIISASNNKSLKILKFVYGKIIKAGLFITSSIKVAEAAKVIENTQRDLNIALINELSMICHKLNIETNEVIKAASTKWNFHKYFPGLVGGHCIGVDPYYLTYKSKLIGHDPKIILSGRKVNDSMVNYIYQKLKFFLKKKKISNLKIKILILGATFKENCPDIRNSQTLKLAKKIKKKYKNIFIYDPIVSEREKKESHMIFLKKLKLNYFDVIILSVPHEIIKNKVKNIKKYLKLKSVFFDLKSIYPPNNSDFRL